MKKLFFVVTTLFFLLSFFTASAQQWRKNKEKRIEAKKNKDVKEKERFVGVEENDMYDGPAQAEKFEFERTKDPATGKVPRERLLPALEKTLQMQRNNQNANFTQVVLNWIERGPVSDSTGPSNGNTRPNNASTSGRIRAVCVDLADVTRKTVWVAGTTGGIWKTTDITVSPANWTLVNDFMVNLSVTAICQNPANPNIMYACTGEAAFSSDLVRGVGVFKSTDNGLTWNLLPSTGTFTSCTRILCDPAGNVYLATRNTGLQRSLDGGSTWTDITPAAAPNSDICDMKLSQTGRLHMATGMQSTQSYFYTDIPTTATSAAGWNAPATPFPSFNNRVEIAVSGNTLYALPANNTQFVPIIYTSTNGGATWAACGTSPAGGLMGTSGQGFWDLEVGINPANSNQCIVGGLDAWKTIDGGATWNKISTWVGNTGEYVHADQHNVTWFDGGNKLIIACDGGIHYSSNGGATFRDRNIGLRIKQFYSVAVHPTTTNYFIGGAQDNGAHQFSVAGLGATAEYHGGDGGFVAVDQLQPQFQFSTYTYNDFYRSTDGGASWTNITLNGLGQFINPWDYDNTAKIIYAANDPGQYLRWNDPQTGNSTSTMTIPAFGAAKVTTVFVSPYTANRVYFGTNAGKIFRVDAANGASPVATDITGASMPAGSNPSCIITGTNDNNLMVIFSNYGIINIWISTDGGTIWTGSDNNLPDMPVRWGMFLPGDNTKACWCLTRYPVKKLLHWFVKNQPCLS